LERASPSSRAWDDGEVQGNTIVSVCSGGTGNLIRFLRVLTEAAVFLIFS
jgi:hypothetical protein